MFCKSVFHVAALALLLFCTGCPPEAPPGDDNTNPGNGNVVQAQHAGIYVLNPSGSIRVFALDASGDVAPLRTISGPNTGLSLPIGIARDTQNRIYVANRTGGTVTVYPIDASGDVAPIKTLTAAGMGSPHVLVFGPGDDLFVGTCPNCGQGNGGQTGIFHFANNATDSDFVIGGATNNNTGLTLPVGVALDESRNLFVPNAFSGNVSVFAPGTSGDQLPIRSFKPAGTSNVQGMTYASNTIFLSIPGVGVAEFPATASGTIPPSAAINFAGLTYPGGLAVDTSGQPVVYISDFSGHAIHVVQTIGIAPFLTANGVTTISGPQTGLSTPIGIMVVK